MIFLSMSYLLNTVRAFRLLQCLNAFTPIPIPNASSGTGQPDPENKCAPLNIPGREWKHRNIIKRKFKIFLGHLIHSRFKILLTIQEALTFENIKTEIDTVEYI